MRRWILSLALILGLSAVVVSHANADGVRIGYGRPCWGLTCRPGFFLAPWYQYWPYNAHFQTPAPLYGDWYGPPAPGYFSGVQPYFSPAQPLYYPGSPLNTYPFTSSPATLGD